MRVRLIGLFHKGVETRRVRRAQGVAQGAGEAVAEEGQQTPEVVLVAALQTTVAVDVRPQVAGAPQVTEQAEVARPPVAEVVVALVTPQAVADLRLGVRVPLLEEGVPQEVRLGVAAVAGADVHR